MSGSPKIRVKTSGKIFARTNTNFVENYDRFIDRLIHLQAEVAWFHELDVSAVLGEHKVEIDAVTNEFCALGAATVVGWAVADYATECNLWFDEVTVTTEREVEQ